MSTKKIDVFRSVLFVVLLVFAVGIGELAGQQAGKGSLPTLPVDTKWPVVTLNVVVQGKDGSPQKIDEQGLQVFEDGAARPIQFPGSPDSPVSLALLIDLSGSIVKRKDAIIAAVKALVKAVPAHSEVTVVDFSFVAFLDLPFTDVSTADFSFFDQLQASGGTALYDAIVSTESYVIKEAKYPPRAIVVFSDGESNASSISRAQTLLGTAKSGSAVVYTCDTARANIFQQERMIGHINMKILAKDGGGTEFNLDPDPEAAAAQIADTIRSQYALQFTAADPTRNGKARKLTIRASDKDLKIRAAPFYIAPSK